MALDLSGTVQGHMGTKILKKNDQKWTFFPQKGIFGLLFEPKYDGNSTPLAPNEFQSLDIPSLTQWNMFGHLSVISKLELAPKLPFRSKF